MSAIPGARPICHTPHINVEIGSNEGRKPKIRIVELDDCIQVHWQDRHGHWHFRTFLTPAKAGDFAAKLACRLLIEEWQEECERASLSGDRP